MKIPEKEIESNEELQIIIDHWFEQAVLAAMESGIYVSVYFDQDYKGDKEYEKVSRIYFEVMDHKFESLHDLKKALNNKAFL